ncbi:acyl-protein synthetase [Celerinatantimonas sp. YJH-8]|uniref:LuxE/PaaK family acyltransferase n=1 Tax=Celerinatantimonas sp. YJH-8 TaxID=3228714 RepID=UPI0038C82310
MSAPFEMLLEAPVYGLSQSQKMPLLLARLRELSLHHREHCGSYRQISDAAQACEQAQHYAELLPLAVRLFKQRPLSSITQEQLFKTLSSSGTSGARSQIFLDRAAAALQSKVLVKIMQHWLGKKRLPMLLVEQPALIANRQGFSARGAGALGLSFLGRDHCYALDEQMQPNWPAIDAFCERFAGEPVFIFGFTFMLWQCLLQPLAERGILLPLKHAQIFHSGGWKKLQHLAVSPAQFNQCCEQHLGSAQVHNFYGMAEQTGTIFVSCEHGHLHAPMLADILIRDPRTGQPLGIGEAGLIQVFSGLPESYPGHSLLTEDLGIWLGEDDCPCGRRGRYFTVLGRETTAEVRGCSDTFS